MDELIQAMSIAELLKFKETYKDNESIGKVLDGYIEVKQKQEAQDKAKEAFGKAIEKLADKLPHPEDVHNVYLAWREVDEEDTSQEPIMVDIVVKQAVVDSEGRIAEPAVIEPQPRYPTHKVNKWVVEVNKGFQVGKITTTSQSEATRRAITVWKRNGTNLEEIGKYPSGAEACKDLSIPCVGDNPIRVLGREGYLVERFDGTFGELKK